MRDRTEEILASLYKEVLRIYRKDLPSVAVSKKEREWFYKDYPHLDRGAAWNRALYDFNIHDWRSPSSTGICMSLALWMESRLVELDAQGELLGLYKGTDFYHAVMKYNNKYYDAFHPEGTSHLSDVLYGDMCDARELNPQQVKNFYFNGPVDYLGTMLYNPVYSKFKIVLEGK